MEPVKHPKDRLKQRDLTRRDFLKFCTVVAGAMGLGPAFGPKIVEAFTSGQRPPVLWLHFAECTGCTEAVLRTTAPWFDDLLFDSISLDYHETLMAAAGARVENILFSTAARALETHMIADAMEVWLDDLDLSGSVSRSWTMPAQAAGMGMNEAPRGALGHWINIQNQKIGNYQMVIPSTWNFGPRCAGN